MDRDSYRRGAEDILDVLYYKFLRAGVKDERVYEILKDVQAAIKQDKISKLLSELGLF